MPYSNDAELPDSVKDKLQKYEKVGNEWRAKD